jgi:hypothetical protein
MTATIVSIDSLLKDMYPLPGQRIKQWVVDQRREDDWECETCPKIDIVSHEDNTGTTCRNVGPLPWTFLDHDCCYTCGELHEATRTLAVVQEWLAEKAKRPPIEQDRAKFSEEVQADFGPVACHPLLKGSK